MDVRMDGGIAGWRVRWSSYTSRRIGEASCMIWLKIQMNHQLCLFSIDVSLISWFAAWATGCLRGLLSCLNISTHNYSPVGSPPHTSASLSLLFFLFVPFLFPSHLLLLPLRSLPSLCSSAATSSSFPSPPLCSSAATSSSSSGFRRKFSH